MLYSKREKGFTMIEILIVVAILALVAIAMGQLSSSLNNVFDRNQEELNLKDQINKLNLYLAQDIRTAVDVNQPNDSTIKFTKAIVAKIDGNGEQKNILPDGSNYDDEIEYKLELIDDSVVLKRNNKIVLENLSRDLLDNNNVPQIDKVFDRSNKRIDLDFNLEEKLKEEDINYEINDRIYVKDTDAKAAVIYYKSNYNPTYIEYEVNGEGPDYPGIKMMDSKYQDYQKIYIELDLGTTNDFEASFNNGSGREDDNDGDDYSFDF
ncbi:MAG: carbohydrate binding domain-containing protein [Bacillota bacterium]